ncbi:low temperature requirement protein A [Latilactobacillus graminis]|uniref:Low temperature requirement protein ltra n=2 Tax=Latilactobacillus graminis TaxID=60519 RepID=A0AA89L4E6_9LACO|nr:low temperature requirement protein A [Latilactobacillus graminis]KRM23422.1 low temperature requirement protein ltra [Latilactobacillus graminis DSM 20719]QFP80232.1 low temperature requirement protein A [Latilactobacillus graminis]
MNTILTKRVSLIELFYDLVFVYMISRAITLIHHLHHGIISPINLAIFVLVMVVFINSWMVQMVFTNRYGESSWTNTTFSFIDMAIILYMSNAFDHRLVTFFIAAGLLSLTLCLQYIIVYFQSTKKIDRQISKSFAIILGLRTITLLIGGILGNFTGTIIALTGIIIGWILPAFTGKYTRRHPIIFAHLLERLTALIILMFGETIVGIADYFTQDNFTIYSLLIFISVVSLFFTYIVEFDHMIDESQNKQTGNLIIYLHYFILFGISFFTVALKFISEETAQPFFAITCLYGGVVLFYIGLSIANQYNQIIANKGVVVTFILTTLLGYLTSLCWQIFPVFVISITSVTIINVTCLTSFMLKKRL